VDRSINIFIEREKIVKIYRHTDLRDVPTNRIIKKLTPIYEIVKNIVQRLQFVIEVSVGEIRVREVTYLSLDFATSTKFVEVSQYRIIA